MGKLEKVTETIAGKTKQLVAEVIGDGQLSDEGRRQQKAAQAKAEEADNTSLPKITNNLT